MILQPDRRVSRRILAIAGAVLLLLLLCPFTLASNPAYPEPQGSVNDHVDTVDDHDNNRIRLSLSLKWTVGGILTFSFGVFSFVALVIFVVVKLSMYSSCRKCKRLVTVSTQTLVEPGFLSFGQERRAYTCENCGYVHAWLVVIPCTLVTLFWKLFLASGRVRFGRSRGGGGSGGFGGGRSGGGGAGRGL